MQGINSIEDLIGLTNEKIYQQGTNLPYLLQRAAIQMSGFKQEHVALIQNDLRIEIAKDYDRHAHLRLLTINKQAVNRIYNKVIESGENYGGDYLLQLNNRLGNSHHASLRVK